MTNGDKIRESIMKYDEGTLYYRCVDRYAFNEMGCPYNMTYTDSCDEKICDDCWIDWLRQEAE